MFLKGKWVMWWGRCICQSQLWKLCLCLYFVFDVILCDWNFRTCWENDRLSQRRVNVDSSVCSRTLSSAGRVGSGGALGGRAVSAASLPGGRRACSLGQAGTVGQCRHRRWDTLVIKHPEENMNMLWLLQTHTHNNNTATQ